MTKSLLQTMERGMKSKESDKHEREVIDLGDVWRSIMLAMPRTPLACDPDGPANAGDEDKSSKAER